MVVGVIAFYFVVANIDTICKEQDSPEEQVKKSLLNLQQYTPVQVKNSKLLNSFFVKNDDTTLVKDFETLFKQFPESYTCQMKHTMHSYILKNFQILKDVKRDTIRQIGEKIDEVVFHQGLI